jgi:hypothetical protein
MLKAYTIAINTMVRAIGIQNQNKTISKKKKSKKYLNKRKLLKLKSKFGLELELMKSHT